MATSKMRKKWYSPSEVSSLLHVHPHTIRIALVRGLVVGAQKDLDTNRWMIPQKWVDTYSPGDTSELLCDFLKRTGISRTSAIHAAKMGKIKLISIQLPWATERKRVYINSLDSATQRWMNECLGRKEKDRKKVQQEKNLALLAQAVHKKSHDDDEEEVNETTLTTRYEFLVQKWKALSEEEKKHFIDYWGMPYTYHSLKIDDERVRGIDVRDAWDGVIYSRSVKSNLTAKIIAGCKAYKFFEEFFGKNSPLDIDFIKNIHLLLTAGTYDAQLLAQGERPGTFKTDFYIIDPYDTGAAPQEVQAELESLLKELKDVDKNNVLTAAAYFLATFESIHPFAEANGRAARLLMNYILVQHEHPPITIREDSSARYHACVNAVSKGEDIDHLVEFLKEQGVLSWTRLDTERVRALRQKYREIRLKDLLKK